jgi:hypothetical protein
MNTVDQRILIPTSQSVVWEYISDMTKNPEWQTDCRNVSFLTSVTKGQGARWRYKAANSREYVVEITAWYEGLGYEYVIVDGGPYRQNQGRVRLQEVAEGTVVQWTFNYDMGGILGGLRNSISTRRNIENVIVESLWALWRQLGQAGNKDKAFVAKSLMRDAPDVEARSQYKPRHQSVILQKSEELSNFVIEEPPISDDDTRPRPAVVEPEPQPTGNEVSPSPEEPLQDPDFVADIPTTVSQPTPQTTSPEPVAPPQSAPVQPESVPPAEPPVSESEEVQPGDTQPRIATESQEQLAPSAAETGPTIPEPELDPSKMDTAKVSVFDIFGVPKPSDTEEVKTITLSPPQTTAVSPATPPPPVQSTQPSDAAAGSRTGLRVRFRRRLIRIRRSF